jgi:hypothetical protein
MFWVGIFAWVVALLALFALPLVDKGARTGGIIFSLVFAVVGGLSWTAASYNRVPTRNVGIVTSFSKPTGEITGAGLQWTKPWEDVDDWDASGQTFDRLGDKCLWVSIAAQRRACIPVQVEWNAKSENAAELWGQYKETQVGNLGLSRFETFEYRRVNPQIDGAITSVFASFDPLGTVNAGTGDAPAPDLNKEYRNKLQAAIEAAIGQDITIRSIAFATPRYDEPTTAAIAAYGQKVLEARNLAVDKQNAKTRADLAGQTGVTPAVQQCLDIANARGKEPGLCLNGNVALTKPIG